jgi:hypothetical protein
LCSAAAQGLLGNLLFDTELVLFPFSVTQIASGPLDSELNMCVDGDIQCLIVPMEQCASDDVDDFAVLDLVIGDVIPQADLSVGCWGDSRPRSVLLSVRMPSCHARSFALACRVATTERDNNVSQAHTRSCLLGVTLPPGGGAPIMNHCSGRCPDNP